MACDGVFTGRRFVAEMLGQVDCQAQAIGAYGFGSVSDPGSLGAIVLTGLLTIFVAIFGIRMAIGEPMSGRDVFGDVLKVGIVITLATSWPAWRTLGYDVVMHGPAEVAASVAGRSGLAGTGRDMIARMQNVDDGITALTVFGTGRNTGGTNRSDSIGDSFRGIALADQEGLANGRIAFLAGLIGPYAIVRLGAGFLLAIAPLMAGLLLFAGTRDVFFGWLRGLGATALASLALMLVHGIELAVLEPWLNDALTQRSAQILTPSAPTELVVITVAFALVSFGLLVLIAKVLFFGGMRFPLLLQPAAGREGIWSARSGQRGMIANQEPPSRAFVVAEAVAQTVRREERSADRSRLIQQAGLARGATASPASSAAAANTIVQEGRGSRPPMSETRRYRRNSASGVRRDLKS